MKEEESLRFGIMIDDLSLETWQVETIKLLIDNGMNLSLIIRNAERFPKLSFMEKIKSYPYHRLFFQVWNHYLFHPKCKKILQLDECINLDNIKLLNCIPIQKGISTFLKDEDVSTIKMHDLDFILRFGFNIIRGEVLTSAKHGVWSFHHDDEMYFRGGPPGFWEFMQDVPVNGMILQKLTDSLDKGVVLKKAYYKTILHSYKAHLNQLYFESESLPLQVCKDLLATGKLNEQASKSTAKIYHAPRNCQMLGYWFLCLYRRIRFHVSDIFRQEDWNVGYIEKPLIDVVNDFEKHSHDIHWFEKKSKSIYYADPFAISNANDTYIFFEAYDYKCGKGHLACALKSEGFKIHHLVLEEDFHLSYPFVFEQDGTIYCLPEANASNCLTLYRFDEVNLKLKKECVLLSNVRAIDPTLFQNDGKWYLWITQKDFPSVKLYLYISDSFKGSFKPYYNNPIKIDCANARPAGALFQKDGIILRPAQECKREYGTAVCLNNIIQSFEKEYDETFYLKLFPVKNSSYNKGIHTFNGNENLVVFDGKKFTFTISGMWHQIKQKFCK